MWAMFTPFEQGCDMLIGYWCHKDHINSATFLSKLRSCLMHEERTRSIAWLPSLTSGTTTTTVLMPFSGITRVSRCQKRTSGLYGARKTNRGRYTNHPAGCHSIRTKQCPPPPSPIFTGRMPFLLPNQQCQSTEGKRCQEGHGNKILHRSCDILRPAEFHTAPRISVFLLRNSVVPQKWQSATEVTACKVWHAHWTCCMVHVCNKIIVCNCCSRSCLSQAVVCISLCTHVCVCDVQWICKTNNCRHQLSSKVLLSCWSCTYRNC